MLNFVSLNPVPIDAMFQGLLEYPIQRHLKLEPGMSFPC